MPKFTIYLCKKININVINLLPPYRHDNRKEDQGTNSRTNKEDLNKQTKRKQASKDWWGEQTKFEQGKTQDHEGELKKDMPNSSISLCKKIST